MPDKNITFEIQEHFGVIGKRDGGWSKELNLIKWNGGTPKYDIRDWDEHHERMSKGLTLSQWEMRNLVDLYVSRNNDAAVARGRAIEAERNARRLAARRKAAQTLAETEKQTAEGIVPPEPLEERQAELPEGPPLMKETEPSEVPETELQTQGVQGELPDEKLLEQKYHEAEPEEREDGPADEDHF